MNELKLVNEFHDFLRRVESTKVIITDSDKAMLSDILKLIAPDFLKKATTAHDILVKVIAKDKSVQTFKQYILVDKESIVATDGYRLAMLPNNENLPSGIYNREFSKIPYDGDKIDLTKYRSMVTSVERPHELTVKQEECKIIQQESADGVFEYVDVEGILKFNTRHFLEFTNGAEEFKIQYDGNHQPSTCKIINPQFPELALVIMSVVV